MFDAASEEPRDGNYFVASYPPFDRWTEAGAASFRRALSQRSEEALPVGLYVHVPFCEERCHYCYYRSYAGQLRYVDAYLDALQRELALYASTPGLEDARVDFVYFGGGTPSMLTAAQMRRLLGGFRAVMPWAGAREVCFECAPRSVSAERLDVLAAEGVTRISLGVQQLDDRTLEQNGRIHQVADVLRAYALIRERGFDVVNLDLIVGLVGETDARFMDSLDRVIELVPESVTLYQLEIPQNTPLYHALRDGKLDENPASWQTKRERLGRGFERLERAGYTVRSAYAAVRDPRCHRFVYQDAQYHGANLIGLGVSSFSYFRGNHQQNRTSLSAYLQTLSTGDLPTWRGYELSNEDRFVREFLLQLKLGGVETRYFRRKFGIDPTRRFAVEIGELVRLGFARRDGDVLVLTRNGLLRADRLIREFCSSSAAGPERQRSSGS